MPFFFFEIFALLLLETERASESERERMVRKRLFAKEAVEFLNHMMKDKPMLPFLIPLVCFAWAIERWVVSFSNWVPLAFAVWATIQYGRFQRQLLAEDLTRRWRQLILNSSPGTPLEPCEWLNKLLMEVWANFMEPKLSKRFSSIVERRIKNRKPKLIERIDLLEFSLGSCPPNLGRNGMHWLTSGDQQIMRLGFEWDSNEMSIVLLAKLSKPLMGTARIVINSLHIKGNLLLVPILDGQAVLYSFDSTPEVRIGVAFGSGGTTELPGVSTWLVKLFTETLVKLLVEPRRGCYSLPSVDLRKKAVGGVLSVTVVSASKFLKNGVRRNSTETQQSSTISSQLSGSKVLQTFIEVELGDLTRRTDVSQGTDPRWDDAFNMVMHGDTGVLKFHLYERDPNNVKLNYLTVCEIKMKYVADDSITFWAIGHGFGVVAKQAEYCGKEIEMVVPFEEINFGELTVRLVLEEWQFSDGSISSSNSSTNTSQYSLYGSPSYHSRTGRKIKVTVVEGRNLSAKDKSGKSDTNVKLQYGKGLNRTKTVPHTVNPVWNQKFEYDELESEFLRVKCYSTDVLGDDSIGIANVNLEGFPDGSCQDVWVPLEKASSGEVRLKIEVVMIDDNEGFKNSAVRGGSGLIELVLIEARDLIGADRRGTSDPYVRVQYGNTKKRTKVVSKTLNPQWNQTLEFPDTGRPLVLHVKDHNAVLRTSSIGDCVVEYERLPPNQTADKWIPLQGVKSGRIHVQVTRRIPEMQWKSSSLSDISALSNPNKIPCQIRDLLKNFQELIEDGDLEGLSMALSEVESVEDAQEEYMLQLEKEKMMLIDKISELDHVTRTFSVPVKASH